MNIFKPHQLNDMITFLKKGNVLAYPTESVWGLGCDPFNETAVEKILSLKNRPIEKGVILVFGSVTQILPYLAHLPKKNTQHMITAWQAPQTEQAITFLVPLVFEHKTMQPTIPTWITGTHNSVAMRVTPHPLVSQLCTEYDKPLVSTSCNPATLAPACDLLDAQQYFNEAVGYLDADTLAFTQPSKIINALTGSILR